MATQLSLRTPFLRSMFSAIVSTQEFQLKLISFKILAREYPIYATQWHPEMNIFEFTHNEGLGTNINHSKKAVLISQYFANFFVDEARKNTNRFESGTEEMKYLIYNYNPFYSAKYGLFDEQMYMF